jgi:TerC family integral membrane protein
MNHLPSVGSPLLWGAFFALILVLLAIDLGLLRRRAAEVTTRAALLWTGVWTLLALGFSAFLHHRFGARPAVDFLTAWVLEKALSVDNLLVFVLILAAFRVPKLHEHRLLTLGILGALVLRTVFVLAGAAIVGRFHAVTYLFGAILLVSGIKLLAAREETEDAPTEGRALKLLRRIVPSTDGFRGGRFFVVEGGKRLATPLLFALVAIESTDLIFAVDSVPAVFGVTTDPFLVLTSNILAILGLRSLFFVLRNALTKLHFLKPALALVLLFMGVKMLVAVRYEIPTSASLATIAVLLGGAAIASLVRARRLASTSTSTS